MIRKIKNDEYLKGYEAMSDGERKDYQKRVGEWLADGGRWLMELTERPMAKSQNIMLLSARWKEKEVGAFAEGARLLTALVGVAETWLPTQLYAKSAYRAVRQMVGCLTGQTHQRFLGVRVGGGYDRDGIAGQRTKRAMPMIKTVSREYNPNTDTVRVRCMVVPAGTDTEDPSAKTTGTLTGGETTGALTGGETTGKAAVAASGLAGRAGVGALVRPRHIDQYMHLLPEGTQKRAAGYRDLMRELDVSREKLRLVMEDPHASDKDREGLGKKVSRIDEQIGAIRRELDAEWEKVAASGRVVMDELGMAHLVSPTPDPSPKERGVDTTAQAGGLFGVEPETAAADDNQRKAALLRKWLIDTRYGNKDAEKRAKYQEKWREKYLEMVRLGGMEAVTEKVREAAKHYGIDIEALDGETVEHSNTDDALDKDAMPSE